MPEQRELPLAFPELAPDAPLIPVRVAAHFVQGVLETGGTNGAQGLIELIRVGVHQNGERFAVAGNDHLFAGFDLLPDLAGFGSEFADGNKIGFVGRQRC